MTTHDAFTGTAAYYARYRVDYPPALYEVARRTFGLDEVPRGRLLDLGTGTGFMALELARHFEQVVGLDVDAEMLRLASQSAVARGLSHVAWQQLPAEELDALDGTPLGAPYRLVTIGSAFHWMDQRRILDELQSRIQPDGGIFLAGMPAFITPDSPSAGDLAEVILPVLHRYLGPRRRAGTGTYSAPEQRWEALLAEAGYEDISVDTVPFTVQYNLDEVIGLLYSTSFANRVLLGDQANAYEADLRAALLAYDPSGHYQRRYEAEWILARPGKSASPPIRTSRSTR